MHYKVYSRLISLALALFVTLFSIATRANMTEGEVVRLTIPLEQQAKIAKTQYDAEVLYSVSTTRLEDDWHWRDQDYYSIRINSIDAARDYGRIEIPFNHYYSEMTLDFARVRAKNGEISELAKDALQLRVTGGGKDFYSDSSRLAFSLPDVAVGSIIEFQYSKKSKNVALPGLHTATGRTFWYQNKESNQGWRADFVHNFSYTHNAPKSVSIHTKGYGEIKTKPKQKTKENRTTRTWKASNVSPLYSERAMLPWHKFASYVYVSTETNWSIVDQWAWNNAKDKFQPTPKLETVVKNLGLAPNATRGEKIRAVYGYLQTNVRYVFAHLGRGGYEPHFANEVVDASYGDCKDQTVLGIALLRMLGVDALPALVETRSAGRSDLELVSLIFDHMIIYIPATANEAHLWMDTTGDRNLFPGLSNYSHDQTALIVDGQGGRLTKIKEPFADNFAHLKINYPKVSGNTMDVDVQIELSGTFEQNTRSWWKYSEDKETNLKAYISSILNSTYEKKVVGTVNNAEDLWKPLSINATISLEAPDKQSLSTLATGFIQAFRMFGNNVSKMQVPHTRKNAYSDTTSYSIYLTTTFEGSLETVPTIAQSSDDSFNEFFSLKYNSQKINNNFIIHAEYHKPEHEFGVKKYQTFYDSLNTLMSENIWLISMDDTPKDASLTALQKLESSKGIESFAYQMALAEHNINIGEFDKALEPAQQAVELDNSNGKAWYLLATVQGFMSMIDESSSSFEKAQALGYAP